MKKIPILSALAVAAITVTACGTPPTIVDSGPTPSFTTQVPSPSTDSAIALARKHGADRLDTVAAHAALEAGKPVLVGLPDGAVQACHSALLVPGDPKVWILNLSGAAPTEGAAMSREQLQYGCDSGVEMPTSYALPAPVPNPPLDQAAKAKAVNAAVPFIYGLPDRPERACHTAVVLPNGDTWTLNRPGAAPVEGAALDRTVREYGCTERGGVR